MANTELNKSKKATKKKTYRLYDDKPSGYVVVWVCANNKELLGYWDRNTITELINHLRDNNQDDAADKLVFLRMCGKLHKQKINLCLESTDHPLSTFLFMSRHYYEIKFNLGEKELKELSFQNRHVVPLASYHE